MCNKHSFFFYIEKQLTGIESINCYAKIVSIKEEHEYKNKYVIDVLKINIDEIKYLGKDSI